MGKKRIGWAIAFFVLVPLIEAIGIEGPILSPLIYEPGKEIVVDYSVYGYNYDVEINKGGDLGEMVTLGPLVEDGGRKNFQMKINFPREIPETGTYYISISAAEVANEEFGGGMVNTLTSMSRNIQVIVYSQEKEIKVSLTIPNINENELVKGELNVQSWSYQDIEKVKGQITIFDEKNISVASLETKEAELKSKESKDLEVEFDNKGLKPGDYRAEAIVDYDGKQTKAETNFKIGTLELSILNYTKEFFTGEINPFNITVRSNWNNPINNVFGVLYVEGEKVLKTPTTSLEAWGEETLKGYWEVELLPGTYKGKIELYFGDKVKEKEIEVLVKEKARVEEPSPIFNATVFLLTSVIVLLGILLVVLYWKRKKKG